ncbi:hypothetical protein GCM10009757_32820 [Streptomyces cheonanensis]|uniref:Uncharacterized protein n=1 Tax=Streptomyces cheonanensis TaxID=312720 RepID=A0ABN2VB36_9ACTN
MHESDERLTALEEAVEERADRLRGLAESRLRQWAAAEGLALARELARRAQLIERPGAEPLTMPDAGLFAVGDQVAVAGHDLVRALRDHPDPAAVAAALTLLRPAG